MANSFARGRRLFIRDCLVFRGITDWIAAHPLVRESRSSFIGGVADLDRRSDTTVVVSRILAAVRGFVGRWNNFGGWRVGRIPRRWFAQKSTDVGKGRNDRRFNDGS